MADGQMIITWSNLIDVKLQENRTSTKIKNSNSEKLMSLSTGDIVITPQPNEAR